MFEEKPDYNLIRKTLHNIALQEKIEYDNTYDWIEKSKNSNITNNSSNANNKDDKTNNFSKQRNNSTQIQNNSTQVTSSPKKIKK